MIKLENISVSFGENKVIDNLTYCFESEITAVMGQSGCGKTTMINCIAGTVKYTGSISGIDNKKIAYAFAEPRLLPWYTVRKNIELVCKNEEVIANVAEKTEIADFMDKYPEELSSGMLQRASLARAFAYDADIILLDEPFKTLDEDMKNRIMANCKGLCADKVVILITHDKAEAEALSDKIVIATGKPLHMENGVAEKDRG